MISSNAIAPTLSNAILNIFDRSLCSIVQMISANTISTKKDTAVITRGLDNSSDNIVEWIYVFNHNNPRTSCCKNKWDIYSSTGGY